MAARPAELHRSERIVTRARSKTRERRKSLTIDEVLALLEDTPRRIAEATADVSPTRLRTTRILGVWSARDVLAHLRSCSDARGDFIPKILADKTPTLRAIDPRTLFEQTGYLRLEFGPSFRAFTRQRARLVKLLKALPRESWSRTAMVTGGGPARERTVFFYAQWLARHEPAHLKHIARIVNAN